MDAEGLQAVVGWWDYIMILEICCDVQIMSANGIELIRTWAFLNGQQDPYTANGSQAIQPQVHLAMTFAVHTSSELSHDTATSLRQVIAGARIHVRCQAHCRNRRYSHGVSNT